MASPRAGRLAWGAAYCLMVGLATLAVIGPANLAWSKGYMVRSASSLEVGDHLQTTYHLWLWAHALVTGSHLPWHDPFQFALIGHTVNQPFGWPLVLFSVPVHALAGPIAAFNALLLASSIAAAGCTYLFVRELRLSRAAAAVAGFAFAFAPFRLAQSDHINSLLAFMLPLILLLADRALHETSGRRRWAWVCVVVYLSLVASGEMHLVLYGTLVLAGFVTFRSFEVPSERLRKLLVPTLVLVVGTALILGLVYLYVVRPSARGSGAVVHAPDYAPRLTDLFTRRSTSERYAYPGLIVILGALVGSALGLRNPPRRRLAAVFGAIAIGAYALALAPGWGPSFAVYRRIPLLFFFQVPGRVLIVAALGLAVLAACALSPFERRPARALVAAVLVAGMLFDATTASFFSYASADVDLRKALATVPGGSPVLDLPPFGPGNYAGSRYQLALTVDPGPRVGGYHAFASRRIIDAQARTATLMQLPPDPCVWRDVQRVFAFDYVVVHMDLFGRRPLWPGDGRRFVEGLDEMSGLRPTSKSAAVIVYRVLPRLLRCPVVGR